jgi:signal transduction histidine kinase
MRIRTRLFVATAALVLALTGVQWWIHARQLAETERALSEVATSVGRGLLASDLHFVTPADGEAATVARHERLIVRTDVGTPAPARSKMIVMTAPRPDGRGGTDDGSDATTEPTPSSDDARPSGDEGPAHGAAMQWFASVHDLDVPNQGDGVALIESVGDDGTVVSQQFEVKVVPDDSSDERYLVVRRGDGTEQRIPIPVSPTVAIFRASRREAMFASAGLLVLGLVGAAVVSHRIGAPMRDLAARAERLGAGELGMEVPVTAGGEVGELQGAFGAMSRQLAEVERERDRWREREHLAQLGDLSRGLAHTLRNPLNTLGLAVEELAGGQGGEELVATARAQIRRIDRWLRSFLALAARDAGEPSVEDLTDIVRAVVLEASPQGRSVELRTDGGSLPVRIVTPAIRAALANLVDNAIQASAADGRVEVEVMVDGSFAAIEIRDRGAGLEEDVRTRLFEPHVTTKSGGSGMGLFLARQLVVGMHDGGIELLPREGGGTVARLTLPLPEVDGEANNGC